MTAAASAAPSAASRIAVVTGASSGIGAATARQLAAAGYRVVLTARRKDRIEALAEEIDAAGGQATAYALDITDRAAVDEFATAFKKIGVLVNNAGGALGADPVASGDPAEWRQMYETNVIGTLNITQALLPALTASGDGTVVVVSSTAGHSTYEGGAGYVAAKHAEHVLAETLRLEIVGTPVRVIEIAPGMVKTDEFALTRFGGDSEKASKVYAGCRGAPDRRRCRRHHHLDGHPPLPRQHRPPGRTPPRPGLQHKGPQGAVVPDTEPTPQQDQEQRRLAQEKKDERYVWWYLAYFLFGIHLVAFVMIYAVTHAK